MPKLRVHNFSISLDGYGAGPDQTREEPLGVGGEDLHEWAFATRAFRARMGQDGGDSGVDDEWARAAVEDIGATIMGRNMFSPYRGPGEPEDWKGWWGPNPPYHHPVFVLTHHPRPPIPMEGGTTFHFVDDGIESALDQAVAAADGADVILGGGVATIQQYLRAGLVDEVNLAIAPLLLGGGERLLDGLGTLDGYECVAMVSSDAATHVRLAKITD